MMGKKFGNHYQYSGAIHMHTTRSDGTKSLEEVAAIGQSAGLDFMMFSDHMDLSNRDEGKEQFYGKTLVLIGYEHNDLDENHHYLLYGTPGVYPREMSAREYVEAGARDGAFGIIAHPHEVRPKEGKYPPYPWVDWSVTEFDGIELWNQMSEWTEKLNSWNKLPMAFSPRKSMVGPPHQTLELWDKLSIERKIVGIVSVDAHAFPISIGPLTVEIFPYKVHFKSLRTHLLLPEKMSDQFDKAREQVYDALRGCRVFGSNMRWGKADGFQFNAENSREKVTIGGSISDLAGTTLQVSLPSSASIRIVGNGEQLVMAKGKEIELKPQVGGLYRVEAWKGSRGWIFSNHIRVGIE